MDPGRAAATASSTNLGLQQPAGGGTRPASSMSADGARSGGQGFSTTRWLVSTRQALGQRFSGAFARFSGTLPVTTVRGGSALASSRAAHEQVALPSQDRGGLRRLSEWRIAVGERVSAFSFRAIWHRPAATPQQLAPDHQAALWALEQTTSSRLEPFVSQAEDLMLEVMANSRPLADFQLEAPFLQSSGQPVPTLTPEAGRLLRPHIVENAYQGLVQQKRSRLEMSEAGSGLYVARAFLAKRLADLPQGLNTESAEGKRAQLACVVEAFNLAGRVAVIHQAPVSGAKLLPAESPDGIKERIGNHLDRPDLEKLQTSLLLDHEALRKDIALVRNRSPRLEFLAAARIQAVGIDLSKPDARAELITVMEEEYARQVAADTPENRAAAALPEKKREGRYLRICENAFDAALSRIQFKSVDALPGTMSPREIAFRSRMLGQLRGMIGLLRGTPELDAKLFTRVRLLQALAAKLHSPDFPVGFNALQTDCALDLRALPALQNFERSDYEASFAAFSEIGQSKGIGPLRTDREALLVCHFNQDLAERLTDFLSEAGQPAAPGDHQGLTMLQQMRGYLEIEDVPAEERSKARVAWQGVFQQEVLAVCRKDAIDIHAFSSLTRDKQLAIFDGALREMEAKPDSWRLANQAASSENGPASEPTSGPAPTGP